MANQGGGPVQKADTLERAITILQLQARSPEPGIRANSIEALQPLADPRAAAVIEQGLHDPEWVVRFAAAMASGKRKAADNRVVLQELAAHDANDSVRVGAIYALRRLGDTTYMNKLDQTLHSPDPSVRANTALVLGLMGDASAIPLLNAVRSEPEPAVKFEIAAALARLGDPRAMKVISAMALSKFAEDQYAAMMVCADLPDDAASPLILGLEDVPPNVPAAQKAVVTELTTRRQLVAARALGKRNSIQGLPVAEKNCHNPNPDLRALAVLALGEMIHGTGERVIEPLLSDPDERVQQAAAQAIVNIHSRAGVQPAAEER